MPSSQTLQLKVSQQLHLAPQVRQALKMMQFSQLELIDHLKDAALNNPLIELEPPRSVNDQQPTWVMPNSFGDPDMPSIDQWASDGQSVSLHAHLLWQANIAGLPEKDYELILALIDFIDDTGLLSMQVSEITESLAKDQSEHVSLSKRLRKALEKLQTFEPVGVGAESIQQCLLIQLQCFHHTDPDFCLAQHLLKDHFQSIGQSNLRELSVQLGVSITALKRAFGLIQRLNPHPATSFGVLSGHHIVPDVYIHPKPCSKSATWMVTLNTAHIPSLKFNQTFEQLWPHASSADKVYLRKQHNNAKALMEGLALRHHTIVRVAEILASHQQDYLRHGPSALRPLTQKEVANQLGVHVSTVSRALKDKYAQTPQGLIQLKNFLSGALHSDQGTIGTKAISALIAQMVHTEDHEQPLTDQIICSRLADKGVKIARRTVAKYRAELGITDSKRRKAQYSWQHSENGHDH